MPVLIAFVLEIYVFWLFVGAYGFLATFAAYWIPTFLGFYMISRGSIQAVQKLQMEINSGGQPAKASLAIALNFLGSLLLIFPFLSTRVMALFLLVPGFKHLIILFGEFWLIKKIFKSPYVSFVYQAGDFARERGFRDVFTPPLDTPESAQSHPSSHQKSTSQASSEIIDVDFVSIDDKKNKN